MAHGHVFELRLLAGNPGLERWVGWCGGGAWRDDGPRIDDLSAMGIDDFDSLVLFERHSNTCPGWNGVCGA